MNNNQSPYQTSTEWKTVSQWAAVANGMWHGNMHREEQSYKFTEIPQSLWNSVNADATGKKLIIDKKINCQYNIWWIHWGVRYNSLLEMWLRRPEHEPFKSNYLWHGNFSLSGKQCHRVLDFDMDYTSISIDYCILRMPWSCCHYPRAAPTERFANK